MTRARLASFVFVAVAVVAVVATFVRPGRAATVDVRVATATTRGVTSRVLAQGKVKAKAQVEVSSEVAGRVAKVDVEVGDVVKLGDPLFSLDGEQLRNAVEQLSAAIAGAEAVLARSDVGVKEAERSLERDKKLAEKGVLADDVLKLTESRLAGSVADQSQARANVQRTRIDLNRARDALGRARVTAPQAGTVVAVGVEVGRIVSSSTGLSASPDATLGLGLSGPGAPVIIADLTELVVKLDVDELDISRVRPGQVAIVRAQGIKDVEFEGIVEHVGLLGKDAMGAVQFAVDVKITGSRAAGNAPVAAGAAAAVVEGAAAVVAAPQDLLRPGMSAQAEIEVEHLDSVIVIPLAAVLEASKGDDGDRPDRVFVVDGTVGADGKDGSLVVNERAVKLGASEGEGIAILSGLKEGDRVVEGPYRALKDLKGGDSVKVVTAPVHKPGEAP